jgi:hypothetical protein
MSLNQPTMTPAEIADYSRKCKEQIAQIGDTVRIDHTRHHKMTAAQAVGTVYDIRLQVSGEFTYYIETPKRKIPCFYDDIMEVIK